MQTDSITASEAAVLDSIQRKRIASLPDIAVVSRLTPSEVRVAVKSLLDRKLVEHVKTSFLKLTQIGEELARENYSRRLPLSVRGEDLDESEVESRLNEIIGRL